MFRPVGILVLIGLVQTATGVGQETWPPAGVYTVKEVTVAPALVTRVDPKYTEQGMRRRIQGFVTLQFVVEPDGTVGQVRVVRSLDAASGLDDQAVATLKQWRFKAGTKDGQAVRVLATAMMEFTLRGEPPPLTLPEGFSSAPDSIAGWSTSDVTSNNVQIQFQYPEGWEREDRPAMAVSAGRARTLQSVAIYKPAEFPQPLAFPMPVSELARFSEVISRGYASAGRQVEILRVGQSPFGKTNWLWLELDLADEARGWAFVTSVGTRVVQVLCVVGTPRLRMTDDDRTAAIAGARTDCANILRRVSVSAR